MTAPDTAPSQQRGAVGALSQEIVRMSRTSHAMKAHVSAQGVDWSAYALLAQLVREGPQRSSALAAAACVDPSTISRQVAALVRAGLAVRRADPDDGRATLLVATEAGQHTFAAVRERRERAIGRLVSDWPEEEVQQLSALLRRLNDSFTDHRAEILDIVAGAATQGTS